MRLGGLPDPPTPRQRGAVLGGQHWGAFIAVPPPPASQAMLGAPWGDRPPSLSIPHGGTPSLLRTPPLLGRMGAPPPPPPPAVHPPSWFQLGQS